MNKPVFSDAGRAIKCTFTECACAIEFDKSSLLANRVSTLSTYCVRYPNCGRHFLDATKEAKKALEDTAYEATLVIEDDETDFCGMV